MSLLLFSTNKSVCSNFYGSCTESLNSCKILAQETVTKLFDGVTSSRKLQIAKELKIRRFDHS